LLNLFNIYNLPISFNPKRDLVKQQYFQLSRKYHPDFISNGTDIEKEEALEMSSLVNKAYKIFNNQDETIKYVLQLKGLFQDEEKYALPKDFLMEMMELNEELIDARMDGDDLNLTKVKLAINNFQLSIYEPVREIIESNLDDNTPKERLLQVKEYYFKKKYLTRILDGIK